MIELKRILHIEDDPEILKITGMALELLGGFCLEQFESGEAGIAAIERFGPQLVVSDVQMPGLTGPETLQEMRKISGYEDIPAVYLTAQLMNNGEGLLSHPRDLGIVGKPFDPATLATELKELWATSGPHTT